MAWDWGPTFGAFLGASVPAVMTYLSMRVNKANRLQDRRWQDAEVLADVHRLLTDIDPTRRAVNVNPVDGAEDELWKSLEQRRDDVQRRLLVLAAGHPSTEVGKLAQELAVELFNTAIVTRWFVTDLLRGRDLQERKDLAVVTHRDAMTKAAKLQAAVQAASR